MKLGLCQMPVTASKTENDTVMGRYVRDAAAAGCDLVALPEMWCCPYNNAAFVQYAEPQGGETWRLLRDTARAWRRLARRRLRAGTRRGRDLQHLLRV